MWPNPASPAYRLPKAPLNAAQQRLRRVWAISWALKIAALVVLVAVLAKFTGVL